MRHDGIDHRLFVHHCEMTSREVFLECPVTEFEGTVSASSQQSRAVADRLDKPASLVFFPTRIGQSVGA